MWYFIFKTINHSNIIWNFHWSLHAVRLKDIIVEMSNAIIAWRIYVIISNPQLCRESSNFQSTKIIIIIFFNKSCTIQNSLIVIINIYYTHLYLASLHLQGFSLQPSETRVRGKRKPISMEKMLPYFIQYSNFIFTKTPKVLGSVVWRMCVVGTYWYSGLRNSIRSGGYLIFSCRSRQQPVCSGPTSHNGQCPPLKNTFTYRFRFSLFTHCEFCSLENIIIPKYRIIKDDDRWEEYCVPFLGYKQLLHFFFYLLYSRLSVRLTIDETKMEFNFNIGNVATNEVLKINNKLTVEGHEENDEWVST